MMAGQSMGKERIASESKMVRWVCRRKKMKFEEKCDSVRISLKSGG